MSTKKQFFPAIYDMKTGMYETTTPYPYAEEFEMYGETWVIHRTPYDPDTPANSWNISHKNLGTCVFHAYCKTKDEAKKTFTEATTPKNTDISPEKYVKNAIERRIQILKNQENERIERAERAAQEAKKAQERAEEEQSIDEEVQEAVKNYAASIKDMYESDDHAEPYAQAAHETITKDNVKRVLINADDLPDHAAELLADIVIALIKNQQIELQEKTVSQYYAPVRTVGYCDHGEQEDQIEFAELEKLGVPDTPAARRMVGRIFSDEGFTVNDTGGKYFHAYHITGNATALLLPYLNTIFSVMQNQETP